MKIYRDFINIFAGNTDRSMDLKPLVRKCFYCCSAVFLTILLHSCTSKRAGISLSAISLGENTFFPYLYADQKDLVISWIETEDDTIDILNVARIIDDKIQGVTEVARGNDWFVNWADFPEISLFPNGKYITHWLQKSSGSTYDYNIHVAIGEFEHKPDTTFILHDDGINAEHGFVSYTPFQEKMLVVWLDGRDTKKPDGEYGQMMLRSVLINEDGKKEMDQLIDDRVCDCCQTDVTVLDGEALVVYRNRDSLEIRDNYYAVWKDDTWQSGFPLSQEHWKIPGCPVNGPAVDSDGSAFATSWFTEADDLPRNVIQFGNTKGMLMGEPMVVAEKNTLGRVDLVMTNNKEAIVSWMEKADVYAKIFVRRYDKNGPVGEQVLIAENSSSRSSGFPTMVRFGENLYIAYTHDAIQSMVNIKKMDLKDI